jgi:hypothetical protein
MKLLQAGLEHLDITPHLVLGLGPLSTSSSRKSDLEPRGGSPVDPPFEMKALRCGIAFPHVSIFRFEHESMHGMPERTDRNGPSSSELERREDCTSI